MRCNVSNFRQDWRPNLDLLLGIKIYAKQKVFGVRLIAKTLATHTDMHRAPGRLLGVMKETEGETAR
ncbi:hypothetical protein C9419_13985 [Paraburkholderia fungorum]|jgi:hypothetical protein|nr:MAG: hypothetical protein DI523_20255 [Paraburkholderia fungorum]QLD50019.1 hypothetical protein C9419_13985 [Paraburkholderia fungorum]